MSSFAHRSPASSSNPNRRSQKPYTVKPADRVKPKRKQSGFLDGLKSIVTGPLSWLSTIGKDQGGSDEENVPEDTARVGSKRPGTGSQKERGGSPVRKRVRRESPPQASSSNGQSNLGGYLDPPTVLKDSSLGPNVPSAQRQSLFEGRGTGRMPVEGDLFMPLSVHTEERRPHRPSVVSTFGTASVLDPASLSGDIVSHSPLRQMPSKIGLTTVASPNSGIRRTTSLAFGSRADLNAAPHQQTRRQSDAIRFDPSHLSMNGKSHHVPVRTGITTTEAEDDQPMRSPINGLFRPPSRSPSAVDVSMRVNQTSPERDRTQGPLRMGSALRNSHTPFGHFKSTSPSKQGMTSRSGVVFPTGGIPRRSSSMMNTDVSMASGLQRRQSSQMIFEPTMGITTAEEAATAVEVSIPRPRVPRNNAERILQALEQATPLSDARKLRMKQKESVRVPAPASSSLQSLGGRTSRMLMPYGRPTSAKGKTDDEDASSAAPSGKAPGALRRYLDAERKAKQARATPEGKGKGKALSAIIEDAKESNEEAMDVAETKAEEQKQSTPSKEDKSVEVTPTLEKESLLVDNVVRPVNMPGRNTSSLRAGRAPTYRTHLPSSRSTNRFSAKYLDDDDDEPSMEEDAASLTPAELSKWTQRGGGTLEVPAGFSFDFSKPAQASQAEEDAVKAAAEKEKARGELIKKLRGDKSPEVNPLQSLGVPMMPQVPSKPIPFAGFAPPNFAMPAFAAQAKVAPTEAETKPVPKYPPGLSVQPPTPVAATADPPATRSFAWPSAQAPQAKPEADIAPKTTNGPFSALPFSFGAAPVSAPPKPAMSPFNFSAPAPQDKPALFSGTFNFAGNKTDSPAPPAAPKPAFPFGQAPTMPSPATPLPQVDVASPAVADPTRSAAPSPSPFPFGKPADPTPVEELPSAQVTAVNPPAPTPAAAAPNSGFNFSFGGTTPSVTTTTPANPASSPASKPPVAAAGPFTFSAPSVSTPVADTSARPNPFANVGVATPATGSPFDFSKTAKAEAPAPFSFTAGSSATKPTAPSPFAFSGTTTPVAGFQFTAPASAPATNPFNLSPSKASTPPPSQDKDNMMDEGSPIRDVQPSAGLNGFTSGATFSPVAASAVPSPAPQTQSFPFGFQTQATNAGSNPFAPSSLNPPATNLFGQSATGNPFQSQPNSPFQSPLQQTQAINSPATTAQGFGSPQQAPGVFGAAQTAGAFSFGAGGGASAATSPTQGNSTPTTPAFTFGAGKPAASPVTDRPIKPLARRTASAAQRRTTPARR